MEIGRQWYRWYQDFINKIDHLSGTPTLLLRLYLAPVLIQAGWNKLKSFNDTVAWFGNDDWGLGLPLPMLMAVLAVGAEILGGLFLLFGFLTRIVTLPLMVTMLVAIFSVHWPNGWLAIADSTSWLADGTILHNQAIIDSSEKLDAAKALLKEHGNYDWLTGSGRIVILNNGIEFAATYFAMLLSLFFTGGGRYVSIDYWIKRKLILREQSK